MEGFLNFVSHILLALTELASKFNTTGTVLGVVGLTALCVATLLPLSLTLRFACEEEHWAMLVIWPLAILNKVVANILIALIICIAVGHVILWLTS